MRSLQIEVMEKIQGGAAPVTRAEYCATVGMIICNNPVTEAMANAWNTHCGPYGFSLPCTEIREA